MLVTHTKELGQIIGGVHAAGQKIGGYIDIPTALNVAQLALKHRENKNLRQRVIVFAASPVETDQDTMVKVAKKLKKNNIAVDIVAFGDAIGAETGESVLRAFVAAVNSSDNSSVFISSFILPACLINSYLRNFVVAPPGPHLLSDSLIASPILSADRSASIPEALGGTGDAIPGPSSSANDFEFGVDPSLDPELAMVTFFIYNILPFPSPDSISLLGTSDVHARSAGTRSCRGNDCSCPIRFIIYHYYHYNDSRSPSSDDSPFAKRNGPTCGSYGRRRR